MKQIDLFTIIDQAVERNELELLFLGKEPYLLRFKNEMKAHDLAVVIPDGIIPYFLEKSEYGYSKILFESLLSLANKVDGVESAATYILCSFKNPEIEGVDTQTVCNKIKGTIRREKDVLANIKTPYDCSLYKLIGSRAQVVKDNGGPLFFPEEDMHMFEKKEQEPNESCTCDDEDEGRGMKL